MNTQYRKNLKSVLEASKKYVDETANDLRYEFGGYAPSIDTDSTASYTKTAPANAKSVKIVSVSGLCEKIAPSTTSDDTLTFEKTLPDNAYEVQCNYIGGMSYKYNQLVPTKTVNKELNGITITSNNDGVYTIIVNNATGFNQVELTTNGGFIANHKYLNIGNIKVSGSTRLEIYIAGVNVPNGNDYISTVPSNTNTAYLYVGQNTPNGTYVIKPQIFDLTSDFGSGNEPASVSDARTTYLARGVNINEYNAYSLPTIRDTKTTSIVVSGNLYNLNNVAQTTTNYGITYKVENGKITVSGTVSSEYAYANAFIELSLANTIPSGTYAVGYFNSSTDSSFYVYNADLNNNGDYTLAKFLTSTYATATGTMTNGIKQIRLRLTRGNTYNMVITPMLVKGTTAPSSYIPYVAPLVKQIPLAVQQLDGYGMGINDTLYNYIDLNAKKYYKKVGKILGSSVVTLYKNAQSEEDWLYYFSIAGGNGATASNQILCNKLETKNTAPTGTTTGCSITSSFGGIFYVNLYGLIQTNDIATALAYIQADLEFIYPLPSVIETDISSYIDSDFKKFATNNQYVQAEMVNEHNANLPSKLEYYGIVNEGLCSSIDVAGETVTLTNNNAKYGWGISSSVCNTRNYDDNKGNVVVGRVDLGTIDYIADHTNHRFYGNVPNNKIFSVNDVGNIICSKYPTTSVSYLLQGNLGIGITTSVSISDISYESLTASEFKTAMSGVYLYYELATATQEDIDAIEQYHNVEENDVITFTNPNEVDIPSTITFLIEEERV